MEHAYFADLNYSLANEDTTIEANLLPNSVSRVFSVAGSGARTLPLLGKNPEHIDIVDLSQAQLYLTELRIVAAKTLSYEEFLFLMGYRGGVCNGNISSDDRWHYFNQLRLSPLCKTYFTERVKVWRPRGFIFLGRWENHFQKLGKIFREYLKCNFEAIFAAQSLEEQIEAYQKHWPSLRFNSLMRVLASEYVFDKFLYKGHFSGKADRSTESLAPYQFIMQEFERVFAQSLVRKNYFFQTLFLGRIVYEEGLPLEAHRTTHQLVQNSKSNIAYVKDNLLNVLKQNPYDFYSLSDTISYLDDRDANQILQYLPAQVQPKSQVVIRSFMRAPKDIDIKSWTRLIETEEQARKNDCTAVYRFHIFAKN